MIYFIKKEGGHRNFMYINSAYLNNSLIDFKDKSKPLIIGLYIGW